MDATGGANRSRRRRAAWAAVLLALAAWALVGRPVVAEEPAEERYVDVTGRVVDADTGEALAGVPVSLLYEVTVTDATGFFRFEKIPVTHSAEVSLRVRGMMGYIIGCIIVDVPVNFYPVAASDGDRLDIEIADPAAGEPIELRLATVRPDEINDYCAECHRKNPCLEEETYDQVVDTGRDLRGIIVDEDQVEAHKKALMEQGVRKDTYRNLRYQDTHPDFMNMEMIPTLELPEYRGRYAYPEGLFLLEGKYVTCDTCHTRHVPTEQDQFVVRPYENNELCYSCHL